MIWGRGVLCSDMSCLIKEYCAVIWGEGRYVCCERWGEGSMCAVRDGGGEYVCCERWGRGVCVL